MHLFRLISSLLACSVLAAGALAQEKPPAVPELPTDPAQWINSPPVTREMLKGKAAVFYFFEEECPRCVGAWSGMNLTISEFEGQPVMFIAVNSGNPRGLVENYLRTNHVNWPTIVDPDRSFEKQFDFTISLQNIKQVQLLLPDGNFRTGDFNNLKTTTETAVKDAKWRVDPEGIPTALRTAWLAVEFRNYADAARQLKAPGRGATAEAVDALRAVVLADMEADLAAAKSALDADQKWEAFKRYTAVTTRFKGYEIPRDVATTLKDLLSDAAIKQEQAALKTLDRARQSAAKSPSARKAALRQLETLVKEHPETEAAQTAQKILDEVAAE